MNLEELFDAEAKVPGVRDGGSTVARRAVDAPETPLSADELRELGNHLAERARGETSVLAKTRGLWIASELLGTAGRSEEGRAAAEEAARTSAKLLWPMLVADALGTPAETVDGWLLEHAKYGSDAQTKTFAALELATREIRAGRLASARSLLDPLAQRGLLGPRDALRRAALRLALDGTTAGLDLGPLDPIARRLEDDTAPTVPKSSNSPHSALCRARDSFERNQRVEAVLALAPYRGLAGAREASVWLALGTPLARTLATETSLLELGLRGLSFLFDDLTKAGFDEDARRLLHSALAASVEPSGDLRGLGDLALLGHLVAGLAGGSARNGVGAANLVDAAAENWGAGFREALLGVERDTPHAVTERLGQRLTIPDDARQALQEAHEFLLDRARDSQLSYLALALALLAGDGPMALDALGARADAEATPALFLALGGLAERFGRPDLVVDAFEKARSLAESQGETALRAEALRGLLRAAPERRGEFLDELTACSDSPEERADYELERLLDPSTTAFVSSLRALFASTGEAGYLLTALVLAETEEDAREILGDLARRAEGPLAPLATLALTLATVEEAPEEARATLRHGARLHGDDVSFAVALHALFDEFVPSASASEWLLGNALFSFVLEDAPESALEATRALGKRRTSPLLDRLRRSLQRRSGDHERLISETLEASRGAALDVQLATFDHLADLEFERGRSGAAELWTRAVVNERPESAAHLLRLEEFALAEGRDGELKELGERLTRLLPRPDAEPYALVLAAAALARGELREARRLLEPLAEGVHTPALASRILGTLARERRDDEALVRALASLVAEATTDLDRMTLSLDLAAAEMRRGRPGAALEHATAAAEARPGCVPSEWLLASLDAVSTDTDDARRAERLWAFARATSHPPTREALAAEAGVHFLRTGDSAHGVLALREALELGPRNSLAFATLTNHFRDERDFRSVLELVEARLTLELSTSERFELEVESSDLALELGDASRARDALERALRIQPTNPKVLRLHARVSAELGDHEAAIQSLRDLVGKLAAPTEKREVWLTLARLYDEKLGRLEAAMDCLEAALELDPDDRDSSLWLVDVLARLGLGERATTHLTALIQRSTSGDEKRLGAIRLAELYETVSRDPRRAYATLDRARKAWPFDALLVKRMAELMERLGESGPRRLMLDRVQKDTQRKLVSERIDAGLLETLAEVARQSEQPGRALVITAAEYAFVGEPAPLMGAGLAALSSDLDSILAPSVLTAPLLNLLRKTGPALDAAFPLDLASLEARPTGEGATVERLRAVCSALGLPVPEVFLAPSLGSRCLPLTREPLRFLVGPRLADLPQDCMDYLILRAIKLQLLGAGAIARSRPEDTWPMLASMLLLFAPQFRPKNVDPRKATQARALVEQGLSRVGYDGDVPVLALETIGSLGDAGENIGEAIRLLASRAALLGMGSPHAALLAISAGSDKPIPDQGPGRFRWFESHGEARDLLLFLTTDAYADARTRVGLLDDRSAARPRPPTRGPALPSVGPVPSNAAAPNGGAVPFEPSGVPSPGTSAAPAAPIRPVSAFAPPPPRRGGGKADE